MDALKHLAEIMERPGDEIENSIRKEVGKILPHANAKEFEKFVGQLISYAVIIYYDNPPEDKEIPESIITKIKALSDPSAKLLANKLETRQKNVLKINSHLTSYQFDVNNPQELDEKWALSNLDFILNELLE